FVLCQQCGRANANRHMEIVSTSVHHRHFDAAIIMSGDMAGVREPSLFRHWKSIQLGADHHSWASAALQDADYAGTADASCNRKSELAQLLGDGSRRLLLVIGKLGIAVQVFVECLHLRVDSVNLLLRRSTPDIGG